MPNLKSFVYDTVPIQYEAWQVPKHSSPKRYNHRDLIHPFWSAKSCLLTSSTIGKIGPYSVKIPEKPRSDLRTLMLLNHSSIALTSGGSPSFTSEATW